MRLNQISDNKGARKASTRVGRGPGSGKGTRAGRGDKGQKSRSGVAIKGFEGGQMPIFRRLPKRGFNNIFRKDFNEVNVGRLQQAIDAKKLDPKKPVTVEALIEAGVFKKRRDGLRVLGKGELTAKISVEAAGASKSAVEAIEKAGGSVTILAAKSASEEDAPKKSAKKSAKKSEDKTDA